MKELMQVLPDGTIEPVNQNKEIRRLWDALQLHHERILSLETKVTLLSSIATQKAKKQRPEGEGEVWVYVDSLGGLTKEDAIHFLDKMEASGWKNDGKPVASWKAVIRVWKRLGIFPSQKLSSKQSDAPVSTLQRILEERREQAAKLKAVHYVDGALSQEWDNFIHQSRYKQLMEECRQLRARIDESLGLNHRGPA